MRSLCSIYSAFAVCVAGYLASSPVSLAQVRPTPTPIVKARPKALPKSGLLAVSSVSGAGTSVTGEVFGGEDIFSGELPPIAGSVYRHGESKWRFSVINNSQDRYSVNVDLIQKSESGATVKFGSYSYTLGPGQSDGDDVSVGVGARRVELNLRSYRNLTARQEDRKER
jgi:hypothetical protein